MPWVETTSQPPFQYSNLTGFVGFREFKVWGNVNPNMIHADPQSVIDATYGPLPAFDSMWPGMNPDVGVTLEQYVVAVVSGDVLRVTAVYSDRRGRDDFLSSFQTESEQIEFGFRIPFILPQLTLDGTNPGIATKAWFFNTIVRFSTWFRIRKTVYFQLQPAFGNPVTNIDGPIARQANKLHNIGNSVVITPGADPTPLWARFEGGDVQRLTWDRFKIMYSWTVESGVRFPGTAALAAGEIVGSGIGALDLADLAFPQFNSRLYNDDSMWLRPPFERVKTIPRIDILDPSNLLRPVFWAFMEYEKDENGFATLPGL